jgi:CRISPR-associated protein Csx3
MKAPHIKYIETAREGQVFNPLPAVVIGGPPHSGKSVLAYSLTQALRTKEVGHYLLRAYPPDGEGDWFLEGNRETVREFRIKGTRSEDWLPLLMRDIAHRHLPLIIDMGGLPTPEQARILDVCTHGVLLTPDPETHAIWYARMARHGLVLLADLRSDLYGENHLEATTPLLRGTLAGLERGQLASGPAFEALVGELVQRFQQATVGVRRHHLANAPVELAVDIEQMGRRLGRNPYAWGPQDLPAVLDYLPTGQPLGLYGRGPNWLYAAVSLQAHPAPFYVFDARLGWTVVPTLAEGAPGPKSPLQVQRQPLDGAVLLTLSLPDAYLDIEAAAAFKVPWVRDTGLILSGKLPLWLWAALVRAPDTGNPDDATWVAVHQPQLEGAVVVAAGRRWNVGDVVPLGHAR